MSNKDIAFYRGKKSISVQFSASEISSDGSLVLLEKIERKHGLIRYFSKYIPDNRHPLYTIYSRENQLKQRIFMLLLGYEDTNDVSHLKNDPLFKDVLENNLASQPTLSRFENSLDKRAIWELSHAWIDRYIESLSGRNSIIIDVDGTDDPTHGNQQLSLFNGYYGQFMYNELFFHDGDTGQIILPVLRPGNSHSNKWFVSILKRLIIKIRKVYPDLEITIRGDSGFSCPSFYNLADEYQLYYVVGIASNSNLKKRTSRAYNAVKTLYCSAKQKHQHFIKFPYKAGSWNKEEQCFAKIESTGKGMNVRYIISNLKEKNPRKAYFDIYVRRGETSENRIKEVKNMCFSDRLSNHQFWANFFRLFLSSLTYEFFLLIKAKIKNTNHTIAHQWDINTIRVRLLKIGACIKKTIRRVYYQLSKSFVYQELFKALIFQ